jgi:hypothetical protein
VDRAASAVDLVVDLVVGSVITGRAELADWVAMEMRLAVVRAAPVAGLAAVVVVDAAVAADVAAVEGVLAAAALVVDAVGGVAADAAVRLWPTAEDSSAIASTVGVGSSFV